MLREAAARRATVTFDYRGRRRLDPYGLLLRRGFWYVVGHDHSTASSGRIASTGSTATAIVGEDHAFDRPAGFDPHAAFPSEAKHFGIAVADEQTVTARVGSRRSAVIVERGAGSDRVVRGVKAAGSTSPCRSQPAAFGTWVLGLVDPAPRWPPSRSGLQRVRGSVDEAGTAGLGAGRPFAGRWRAWRCCPTCSRRPPAR